EKSVGGSVCDLKFRHIDLGSRTVAPRRGEIDRRAPIAKVEGLPLYQGAYRTAPNALDRISAQHGTGNWREDRLRERHPENVIVRGAIRLPEEVRPGQIRRTS